MRKINASPIICFAGMTVPTTWAAIHSTSYIIDMISIPDSKFLLKGLFSIPMILIYNILVHRVFLRFRPLHTGFYDEGSPAEFTYNIYVLYYLLMFNPLLPTLLIPLPIMRMVYLFLGAKLGENTYSAGVILDPPLVNIGSNTILGFDSVICPHAVEGNKVYFAPIKIGNQVTIGMRSIIMAGSIIEDHAIIAAGSIVKKGSHIRSGEIWAGVPAKKLE